MPSERTSAPAHDLAISAVRYDAMLVGDLTEQLAARLRSAPVWAGHSPVDVSDHTPTLLADSSRVALVLHQRLWGHDGITELDEAVLRERVRRRPESVRVVTLDHAPVPVWLAPAARCDFAAAGTGGVVEFALDAVTASGGAVKRPSSPADAPADTIRRWPEGPPPFLAQPRSQTALRRELDAIATESKPRLHMEEAKATGGVAELHSLPNRLIARFDDVGISFSWVAGRFGTVADGRLMVIQWAGVAGERRGLGALKSATPIRERVYHAESNGPDNWCWRADEPNGRACSTANLVAEWFTGAAMASIGGVATPTQV